MNEYTSQPWFWPVVIVSVGLPIALLLLHELHSSLLRSGRSAWAKPVLLLRNWVLPALAAYMLIRQFENADANPTWSKITATVFGFFLMLTVLSSANAALFGGASAGSWRSRLPGIFVDLGRLVLILIGIAMLLSWVWGANIGGLITAVGVTSIVIGLAVQNAVGPVISGLLLLFEQPFTIGDWLDTKFVRGRVIEVNWRAVHIDTENGVQVVPNAALAGDAFTNLSRTVAPYFKARQTFAFSAEDQPGAVRAALLSAADGIPLKLPDVPAKVTPKGGHAVHRRVLNYRVMVPVVSPADEDDAVDLLIERVWYAAQRAGLHLENVKSPTGRPGVYLAEHIGAITAKLGLDGDAATTILSEARVLLYGAGETIQPANSIPEAMGFITEGRVGLVVFAEDGRKLPVAELSVGDYFGGTALTRQRMVTGIEALVDTTVVAVSRDAMTAIVRKDYRLARQIGDAVDMRRRAAREVLSADAALGLVTAARRLPTDPETPAAP